MIAEITISSEVFNLVAGLGAVAFAATLSALGWLMSSVGKLKTDVAVIRQRLADLPCDTCNN